MEGPSSPRVPSDGQGRDFRPAGVISGLERHRSAQPRSGRLEVSEAEEDGIRVVEVRGELDLATAAVLCSRLDAARAGADRRLVVDLSGLEFCDSTGLRALLGAAQEVSVSAGRLAVVMPQGGDVRRLFEITGAGEFLPLERTRHAALRALGA
jgi:anti-sigma B factor antagonist